MVSILIVMIIYNILLDILIISNYYTNYILFILMDILIILLAHKLVAKTKNRPSHGLAEISGADHARPGRDSPGDFCCFYGKGRHQGVHVDLMGFNRI